LSKKKSPAHNFAHGRFCLESLD